MANDAGTDQPKREDELRRIPFLRVNPRKRPKGVRGIGQGELDGLGVDIDGRLYWQGRPVEIIGQRLVLSFWQRVYALILGAGAFAAFVVTLAQGLTALADWMCKVQWVTSATFCAG
jgi:hypothetical protein